MKVSLTIADRVSLQIILPDKDNFENLCLRGEILEKTKFSSKEIEQNKIVSSKEGSVSWIETESKEFEFNSAEVTYVNSNLKRLSEAKELTSLQVPLYKLFSKL